MRLPEDIEVQIILRLPSKSVQRFKAVCKRWESLISSPNFITMYNHHYCRRRCNRYFCYTKDRFNARPLLGVINYEESKQNVSSSSVVIEFPPFYRDDSWAMEGIEYGIGDDEENIREFLESNSDPTPRYDIHIMGPVNGVYCIYQRLGYTSGGTLILWNPSIRSYKYILPHISFPFPIHWHDDVCTGYNYEVWSPCRVHMGFGYDPTTTMNNNNNDCIYKFVVIYRWCYVYLCGTEEVQISVYNSSSATNSSSCITLYRGGWDSCSMPYYIYSDPPFCNSFLNGRCHFSCAKTDLTLAGDDMVSEYGVFIVNVSMDEDEHNNNNNNTFKYMRGPPIPVDPNDHKISPFYSCRFSGDSAGIRISVWVLRETIAMVAFYPESQRRKLEVWIMTEYGVEDSWNLLCSIPIEEGFDHVVGIPDDHRIFVGNSRGDLLSYVLDDDDNDDCDQAFDGVKTTEPLGPACAALGLFSYEVQQYNHFIYNYYNVLCFAASPPKPASGCMLSSMRASDVSSRLEEQKGECLSQLKENEMLRDKLKQLADHYTLSQQQYAQELKQKSLELKIAELKVEQNEEKLTQEQAQIKVYAEKISQLLETEKSLRQQLTADGEKFQQFQDALLKSNEVFETFKQEIEKMSKLTKDLKKENTFLKSKCEKSDYTLIELVEERERMKKQLEKTKNQKEKLESLCRSLQAERKQGSIGPSQAESVQLQE